MRSERQDARDLIEMGQLTAKTQQKLHAADPDAADSEPIIYEPVRLSPPPHRSSLVTVRPFGSKALR